MLRLGVLAAVATLLLAVTACGSKKSSSSASSTTPTVTTETTSTSTETAGSTGDGTTTVSNDLAKSCLNFASAAGKLGQALGAGGSAAADSEGLKKYFEGLASKAPSDIKASFQTLAAAVAKYVDGIKGLNLKAGETPSAADMAKLQSAAAALSVPAVQAASKKIQTWVSAGCHS